MKPVLKSEAGNPKPEFERNPPASVGSDVKASPATVPRILLLALGNDILSDDAVGFHVAREIRRRIADTDGIEIVETAEMGLSLLDYIVGFDDLILVDAVQTGQARPGFLHEFTGGDLKILPTVSPHFLGLGEVLALGRQLGLSVPGRVRIFAIEVEDPFTLGHHLTEPVRRATPGIVARILAAVRELTRSDALRGERQRVA